jgi:hypothetical protein
MNRNDDGWRPWRILPLVAGGVVSVPVVVGFVTLGAVVVVARSVRDLAREAWGLLPSGRHDGERRDSDAA